MRIKPFPIASAVTFLIFGYLLLGIAHIAILPPWEGFDESAHYSSIQQIADRWELPRWGIARLSKDVEEYSRFAPIPYKSKPPFEKNGGYTYKSFFEASSEKVAQGNEFIHKRPLKIRNYSKSNKRNWQAKHPPLYYFLLSPVYMMTRHLSWGKHLFILRFISYLFAWSALMVAFYTFFTLMPTSSSHQEIAQYHWSILGVALWPVLFPQWFPEMARLGNDSLCALIISIVWLITLRAFYSEQWTRYSITLGLLLGLGCLTKAFFEPITVGILSFWVFRRLKSEGKAALKSVLVQLLLTCAVIACVAGWWYIYTFRHGALQADIALRVAEGLGSRLAVNFSIFKWLRSNAAMMTTVVWAGTWSLARPPYVYLAPMAFIFVFTAISYLLSLRRFPATGMEWLPAWLSTPMLMGLSYYIIAVVAYKGRGSDVGGWYLHILAVPLGAAVGQGLGAWWHKKRFRKITVALLSYAVLFSVVISWVQILLFSGLVFKSGANKFYQFPDTLPPFLGLPVAIDRLRILAFPELGVIMWMGGGIMVVIGLMLVWKIAQLLKTKPLYP